MLKGTFLFIYYFAEQNFIMKNIIGALFIISFLFASCTKEDKKCDLVETNFTAPASETANVQAYLNSAGITDAKLHPSGFYYRVTQVGSGQAVVNLCSQVTVKYVGKLTNGNVFDQTPAGETRTFTLGGLIAGWQSGIPLISSGGKITLYIPPSLAYGNNPPPGTGITSTSILVFDIELVSVS